MMISEHEHLWQAVQQRDPRFDGQFVFAVRSTGIYCRPSCPSRRPNPEQVQFFPGPTQAEQAGFRACKRCRPNGEPGNPDHQALAQEICRYLDERPGEMVTLAQLAGAFHLSPYHLQRLFKRVVGISPRQYAQAGRSQLLKNELKEQPNVTQALYQAGYGGSSSLYGSTSTGLGMTPAAYQRGGDAMQIDYTLADCSLGLLLVAATPRGVCAVSLGSSAAELEAQLQKEYPRAELRRDDSSLADAVHSILSYLEGSRSRLDLPLDIQATAFQWQVWDALRAIPYGETRSYSQVAEQIGQPSAARAVARACASNRAALVIPCHRVVGASGNLSGYRWGVGRKKQLLEMEKGN